jgi:hypothetical protein
LETFVPWIIDYETVLHQMKSQDFKCLYYNSGAFGFPETSLTRTLAWSGPEDPTVKPAARELMRAVAPPYESNLAGMAAKLWRQQLPGRAWLMPMSHWSYELSHGSREWMPALIESLDLDPGLLENRNNAAAIEFSTAEAELFTHFVGRLLLMLNNSDFMIAFPGRPTLCTVHHHKQLWWTTTDEAVLEAVEESAVG